MYDTTSVVVAPIEASKTTTLKDPESQVGKDSDV